jgi:hypothetical protein
LKKIQTLFDRILIIIERKNIRNVAELSALLGYGSPQKIYRLRQAEDSKPSYDIIHDFSNKFEDLNMRWFLTGEGEPFQISSHGKNMVAEPAENYKTQGEIERLKNRIAELEIERKALLLALREVGAGKRSATKTESTAKKKK